MNSAKKILTLAVLALAGISQAQPGDSISPPPTNSSAVLGNRYLEADGGLQKIRHISKDVYDVGVGGNLPVAPGIDLNGHYEYAWLSGSPRVRSDIVLGTATFFAPKNMISTDVKPFLAGSLGYRWDNASTPRTLRNFLYRSNTNYGLWGLAVGVEIPAQMLSITPFISYNDDFRHSHSSVQTYNYGAEANYWFPNDLGVFAGASYQDVLHSVFDSWNYIAGVRMKI